MIMLEENTSQAKQEIFILIAGIGSGCLFQPPMIALQTAMPLKDMAIATAAYGLVRSATLPSSPSLLFLIPFMQGTGGHNRYLHRRHHILYGTQQAYRKGVRLHWSSRDTSNSQFLRPFANSAGIPPPASPARLHAQSRNNLYSLSASVICGLIVQ